MLKIILLLFLNISHANPPVIWQGDDALFINPGSIIVPGITPAGVCKIDSTGLFSSGTVSLSSEVTGTLPIANGGTGQTTANAALNALLPSQAGNAGEYLITDGSNTSWAAVPTAPTGTPNRFTYFDSGGNLASLNNWAVNSFLGATVTQAPTPTDSGVSTAYIYNQHTLSISPTNDLATDFLYGKLEQHNLNTAFDYNGYTGHEFSVQQTDNSDITAEATTLFPRMSLGVGGSSSTSQTTNVIKATSRASNGHSADTINGIYSDVTLDAGTTSFQTRGLVSATYIGGSTNYAYGADKSITVDGDILQNIVADNNGIFLNPGSSTVDLTTINAGVTGNIYGNYQGIRNSYVGDITGGATDISLYHEGLAYNNYTAIDFQRNGYNLQNFTLLSGNLNTGSSTTQNLNFIVLSNAANVGQGIQGVSLYNNGVITDGFTGLNLTLDANAGNGGGDNLAGVNYVLNNHTYDANINGFAITNNGDFSGPSNNTLNGVSVTNTGPGHRVTGLSMFNEADMDEEIRGVFINSINSNARTKTLVDLSSSGNTTDDFQALRINMQGETSSSTTQHPIAIGVAGGQINIGASTIPFSTFGVDLSSLYTTTAYINSGSPLTGTDIIGTLVQTNLIANDDIATGPFGLNTTMLGATSQVAVASGKTVPLMRSMLVGTSVPTGAGGTITEHVAVDIIGLPSFGGAVTNPTRTALQDALIVGQEFCDGATDCWFLRNQDDASENHLYRLNINTSSKKNIANTRLEINDGHIRSNQTTAPVASVNSNAGTGASCSVSGATDTAGTINLTTGSGAWASGTQCTVSFNFSYNSIPKCQLTPGSSTAALAALNTYLGKSTTDIKINFVNPDIISNSYEWDYNCVETY